MAAEFQASPSRIAWVCLAYLLCETGFLLPFGKLADMKGGKPVYLAGLLVFLVGSALCASANKVNELILFRALQGVGGALLYTVMLSFIALHLPPERRVGATGLVTTAAAAGFGLGPPLGGWIETQVGWRWIFLVNIPFCAVASLAAVRYLPAAPYRRLGARFDLPGAVFSIVVLVCFLFGVNQGVGRGWTSPIILTSLALAAVFTVAFAFSQLRAPDPLLDVRLFRDRTLALILASLAASFSTVGGVVFLFPFYLVDYSHLKPDVAGMLMTTLSVGQFAGPFTGRLSQRFGAYRLCLAALGLSVASFLFFLSLTLTSTVPVLILAMGLFGLAQGFGKAPNTALAMDRAPASKAHQVSSILGLVRSLPMALGVLFFATLFSQGIPRHVSLQDTHLGALPDPSVLAPGFHHALTFGLVVSVAAMVAMIWAWRESAPPVVPDA